MFNLRVFGVLLFWRLALWWLPLSLVFRLMQIRLGHPRSNSVPENPESLARTVRELSRIIPQATCLTQAVALFRLCHPHDGFLILKLGVARDPDGSFHSHAWVEADGVVLIGGEDLHRYQVIMEIASGPNSCGSLL